MKIYFADLTYNTLSVVNDGFPLNIGYVANYCRGLSFNILGADRLDTNPVYEFNYDVEKCLSNNDNLPLNSFVLDTLQDFNFCDSHDQTNLIDKSLNKFEDNLIGIARLLSDILIPTLLRKFKKSD